MAWSRAFGPVPIGLSGTAGPAGRYRLPIPSRARLGAHAVLGRVHHHPTRVACPRARVGPMVRRVTAGDGEGRHGLSSPTVPLTPLCYNVTSAHRHQLPGLMSLAVHDRAGPKRHCPPRRPPVPYRSLCAAARPCHRSSSQDNGKSISFRHLGSPWVPSRPVGGAHCDRHQSGSKLTASLAPLQRQSDPEYTRWPLEDRWGHGRLFSGRRRAPPARQSRKGPAGP